MRRPSEKPKRNAVSHDLLNFLHRLLLRLRLFSLVGIFAYGSVARAAKTALVVLVTSCPCSLVLSVPLTYFAGIGRAAGRGIVFRGGETVDAVAAIETVVFVALAAVVALNENL